MPIAVHSRPGYCSRCQQWLGGNKEIRSSQCLTPFDTENNAALWQAKIIGELFAAAQRVSSPSLGKVFTANFRACVDAVAEGNQCAFARAAGVRCSTVGSYLTGKALPQISTLLRISFHASSVESVNEFRLW
jgi:hypothetical protein